MTTKTAECPMCEQGSVELYVSGVYVETIECPDCNGTGIVSIEQYFKDMEAKQALMVAMADEQYKY